MEKTKKAASKSRVQPIFTSARCDSLCHWLVLVLDGKVENETRLFLWYPHLRWMRDSFVVFLLPPQLYKKPWQGEGSTKNSDSEDIIIFVLLNYRATRTQKLIGKRSRYNLMGCRLFNRFQFSSTTLSSAQDVLARNTKLLTSLLEFWKFSRLCLEVDSSLDFRERESQLDALECTRKNCCVSRSWTY